MKKTRKIIALVLCFSILMCSFTTYSSASLTSSITGTDESRKEFGNKINDIIQSVVKGVCTIYPAPRTWKNISEFDGKYVYDSSDGRQGYISTPSSNAAWNIGYASGSIIPDDFAPGKYYLGRQLNFFASGDAAKAKGVLDDQRVRVICMDDGSGKGAVVMAVIDGLGVTSATIRKIRAALSDYVADGRIAAINVSATHCHSALDTQGVSTSFAYVLLANIFTNILGTERASTSNDPFIDNLVKVSAAKIKEAYSSMEKGNLYYYKANVSSYVRDKRGYVAESPEAGILHFVPSNEESKDTYFVDFTCHPTNVSANAGLASSDYLYYMDYAFGKKGANFIMAQGAVGQLSAKGLTIDNKDNYLKATKELGLVEKFGQEKYDDSDVANADIFGEKMAEVLLNAEANGRETLAPVINTAYTATQFKTDNYTLHLACRCRLVDNEVYKTGNGIDDVVLPSEIGYLEFGNRVAFGLFPCELYPEVFHGQETVTVNKQNYSWDGSSWNIKSAHDMVPDGVDVYAICFANDYIGYVVPDNFYSGWGHWALKGSDQAEFTWDPNASVFDYIFRGTADQLLSAGKGCASQIMTGFDNIPKGPVAR